MRKNNDPPDDDGRAVISWGHVPPNPMIEARISSGARRVREIDGRILCKVFLDEVHEFGQRAATYSAEVVLVPHKGNPIVSRFEAPPGSKSQRLPQAIARAFRGARRQLLDSRSRVLHRRNGVGHASRSRGDE